MKIDHAAQCRFFTAADACRVALQAYYAASRHLVPPNGEPWYDESGAPWASCTDFADAFNGELQARIALLALDRLGEFYTLPMEWQLHKLAAEIEPDKMAPIIAAREIELAKIDAEFFGESVNDLPTGINPTHNRSGSVADNAR
jgi:hypothetical protein